MNFNTLYTVLEQFHFIRPEFLWCLPGVFVLWLLMKASQGNQLWSKHISKEMLAILQIASNAQSRAWKWMIALIWIVAAVAAAGPSWDKQTAPALKNQNALVLVLDLSPSMLAQDLVPDRLTRAKYKLIDVLRQQADGQAALIAYAGDAHTVSPLSDDPSNLEALLRVLHPNVMPSQGSNTESAIDLAQQLLRDAGLNSGEILLISDGVNENAINYLSNSLSPGFNLSILAVGGLEPAPIPDAGGGFVRNKQGEIILSGVNAKELQALSVQLGGRFSMLTADDSDIKSLQIGELDASAAQEARASSVEYDAWVDMGHYLALFLLPLSLLLFRKGRIYAFLIVAPLGMLVTDHSYAAPFSWNDLWQTEDQQAYEQYQAGDFESAANTFNDPRWSAIANYQNKNYQQTIDRLEGLDDVTSLYNLANALAMSGELEQAIKAYDKVLEQMPNHADAAHNKRIIEQLQQQQQQQQQNQNQQNQDQQPESENSSQDQSQSSSEQQNGNEGESSNKDEGQNNDSGENDQAQQQDSQQQGAQDSESQSPQGSESSDDNKQNENQDKSSAEEAANESDDAEGKTQAGVDAQEQDKNSDTEQNSIGVNAVPQDEPLEDASEQWLRGIQDDPSGLLRRKFDYQARQRAQQRTSPSKNEPEQERY